MKFVRLFSVILGLSPALSTGTPAFYSWAEAPTMGWNSWDFYGTTITEAQTKAQADYMDANLKSHGWNLITVDIQWYAPNAANNGEYFDYDSPNSSLTMDGFSRLIPATNRFPSAAGGAGFGPLATYVHGKGLRFGIHIMRGIPKQAVINNLPIVGTSYKAQDVADTSNTCPWNPDMYGVDMSRPGAQAYYDSLFALYASWGVDFVKVDDISRPYTAFQQAEIEAIRSAIGKTGREIVLSLSPGATPLTKGDHVMLNANQWRISDDFWDNWGPLLEQFQRLHDWTPYRGPGHFPDADMIPIGKLAASGSNLSGRTSNFNQNEQYTLMSLWSIARSPLIHGGDLTQTDAFTLSLLTNDEVIAVNQSSTRNRQLFRNGNQIAWVADHGTTADKYLAVFNTGSSTTNVTVDLSTLGLVGSAQIRSLWNHADLGSFSGSFSPSVGSHGAAIYRLAGVFLPTPSISGATGSDRSAMITWETLASANSYRVKRATNQTGPFQLVAENLTGTSFTDSGLINGTIYYYTVSAMISGQETPDSSALAAVPTPQGVVSWNYNVSGNSPVGTTATAGVVAVPNWNDTVLNDLHSPANNLRDSTGATTTMDVSWTSNNDYAIHFSHPGTDADGSLNREILNGYLNAGSGNSSTVTLSAIDYSSYDIYVYFGSDVADREGSVTDGTSTYYFRTIGAPSIDGPNAVMTRTTDTVDSPQDPAANYAVFTGLSGASKTISVNIPNWGGIAAVQVVRNLGTPVFFLQPQSSTYAPEGSTVMLSANASTTGNAAYQWFKNGSPMAGKTSNTLTLANLTVLDDADYFLRVTDDAGAGLSSDSQVGAVHVFPSWGGLVSHDPFDTAAGYTPGELPLQNPAVYGYGGPWTDVDFANAEPEVQSGSLIYPDPLYLGSSGDHIAKAADTQGVNGSNSGRVYRMLTGALAVGQNTTGVRYLSWLYRNGNENAAGNAYQHSVLSLYQNTGGGNPSGDAALRTFEAGISDVDFGSTNYGFRYNDSLVGNLAVPVDSGVHLFVAKFALSNSSASDTLTVWIDPSLGSGEPAGGVILNSLDIAFDSIAFSDYSSNSMAWDEVRWGGTFDSVTHGSSPPDDFNAWIADFPGVGAMTAFDDDADGDGLKNGVENYLGTDPSVFNQGVTQTGKNGNVFTFQHPQNPTPASDVSAAYRWSLDLNNWNADGGSNSGTTVNFVASLNTPVSGVSTVTANIVGTVPKSLFTKLKVTQTTP